MNFFIFEYLFLNALILFLNDNFTEFVVSLEKSLKIHLDLIQLIIFLYIFQKKIGAFTE
jgi:hypothetical protein